MLKSFQESLKEARNQARDSKVADKIREEKEDKENKYVMV